jgi:hypothetical protein
MKRNLITVAVSFAATFALMAIAGSVSAGPAADSDGDGIQDGIDNCTNTPNNVAGKSQLDTNRDGIGNACDADLSGDGLVAIPDFGTWFAAFPSAEGSPAFNPDADLTGDGLVAIPDFGVWFAQFPSVVPANHGRASAPTPPVLGTSAP